MLNGVHAYPHLPLAGHCAIFGIHLYIIEQLETGRAPVVSSKHTVPLLSWYNSPPISQQMRVVGSKGTICVCVCLFNVLLVKDTGRVGFFSPPLSDIAVLPFVSKVQLGDTGCKSSIKKS